VKLLIVRRQMSTAFSGLVDLSKLACGYVDARSDGGVVALLLHKPEKDSMVVRLALVQT